MTKSTQLLGMEDLTAGMALAVPLFDTHQDILLPAGAVLSDASIASLRRRGITRVEVVSHQHDDADVATAAGLQQKQQERLHQLFRRCADEMPSQVLFSYLSAYRGA